MRPKKIKDPKQLEEIFKEYKSYTKTNPRFKYHLNQRTGDMVGEPLEVPFTIEGFEIFCHDKYNFTAKHYLENTNKAYEDFCTISTRIRKEIRDDQIKGGMVGQYNPSITARLNALKEQIEQTNIEQPLFPDVSKNNGDK
jgi:DNA polymerase II small subunit/DNA polymerase delta subunit B|tara:strand:+ start:4199 stop:4618 length:420 start_codon:yes stop_codon:yes gene_type:complete